MITNKWIMGREGIQDALLIRREVFLQEQGVSPEEEFDGLDDRAFHLILYNDGVPAATGRLLYNGEYHIGRIAVRKNMRQKGLGDLVVRMLLLRAFNDGADLVTISAQTHAVPFYERFGFVSSGSPYQEAGIEHIFMSVTRDGLIFQSKCGSCTKDCVMRAGTVKQPLPQD